MKLCSYITLVGIVLVVACQPSATSVEPMTFAYDSLYRLELPNNLYRAYDMHEYASLQYYDTLMGFYVLGIEDPKENLGEIKRKRLKQNSYYAFVEKTVFKHVDSIKQVSAEEYSVNPPFDALVGDYYTSSRELGMEPVFYRIAVFENPEYYFQLVTWMPYDVHCEYIHWIDTMTQSFRFLEPEIPVAGIR